MPSLLPTPEPADPVEGQPGHFEHSNWLKASVKALDSGVVHKAGDTMTGVLAIRSVDNQRGADIAGYGDNSAGLVLTPIMGGSPILNDRIFYGPQSGGWVVETPLAVEDPQGLSHAATKRYVDSNGFTQRGSFGPVPSGGASVFFPVPFKVGTQPTVVASVVRDTPADPPLGISVRPGPGNDHFIVDVFNMDGTSAANRYITYIAVGERP